MNPWPLRVRDGCCRVSGFHWNVGKKNVSVNGPAVGVSTRPDALAETLQIISLSKSQAPELAKGLRALAEEFRFPALGSGHAGLLAHHGR